MKFKLVKRTDFNREKFKESLTWAQYEEPTDIDMLAELGFDREDVTAELEKVGWSDEYFFPVPEETRFSTFVCEYRKAVFKMSSGKMLDGYVVNSGHCIYLFGTHQEWGINMHHLDMLEEEIKELKIDVGIQQNECLLPLKGYIDFKKAEFSFP
ncbi:MAG: hypothetical protein COA45_06680 [Zetaproteobacteria bacterium]|nr:MAG: hypothetical protein COA45_06680 [Zetaproteobacteria bacterium]